MVLKERHCTLVFECDRTVALTPSFVLVHRRLVQVSKVGIVAELQENPITPHMDIDPVNAAAVTQHQPCNFPLPVWHPGSHPHFYEPHPDPLRAHINSLGILFQFQARSTVLPIQVPRISEQERDGHTAHYLCVDAKPD